MPTVLIERSPVAPERSPAEIRVRDAGRGPAVVLLHGGWGYEEYPFDGAIAALSRRHRVVAPDRVGYGRSSPLAALPRGFHRLMAEETLLAMSALGIDRAVLWGHSDGAVVAAWAALVAPERVRGLVLEALHFVPSKERSVQFFRDAVEAPERFGAGVVDSLRRDHGDRWREVVAAGGRAWLSLIEEGRGGRADLFDGRLGEVRAPAMLLHGRRDPRTEPGEVEAAVRALPCARLEWIDAGHAPHASAGGRERCTSLVEEMLASLPA